MRRILFRISAAVFALLFTSFTIWRLHLAHEVNAQLQLIRAAGLPTSGAELNAYYPAVSDDENAALVMSQAFELMALYPDIRLSKIAVAIEQFRLLQHRLPLTLDELPTLGSIEMKTDPFDGQPLRYHRLEKGYVIYSVGRDGHDNNGRERPANTKSSDKSEYDITFTVER